MKTKTLICKEVAQHIDVPIRTFYRMLKDGRFPVKPIEGTKPRRWLTESVNKWLESGGLK